MTDFVNSIGVIFVIVPSISSETTLKSIGELNH